MPRFFGTDGVRGIAYEELTIEMAEALGFTAVGILGPKLLIGRDTRESGQPLEDALVRGIQAAGGDPWVAGIIPTPAVAFLVREHGTDGGVVISASHNTPEYNGIKFFDNRGFKLTESEEDRFEEVLQSMSSIYESVLPDQSAELDVEEADCLVIRNTPAVSSYTLTPNLAVTPVSIFHQKIPLSLTEATMSYIEHSISIFDDENLDLKGLTIVVDCAHGAAWQTTPVALAVLGARVIAINADTDGALINVNCGSTDLDLLQRIVLDHQADIGIAHDGDADRLMAIDALGNVIDGDFIEAICARDLKQRNLLRNNTVVSTTMANLGFVRALESLQIELVRTDVGDSRVLAAMLAGDFNLGGEQSGHLIFLDHNSTGDGLASALYLLAVMRRTGQPLHELATVMQQYPQVLINVVVSDKDHVDKSERLAAAEQAIRERLGTRGRVLLRPSGTEAKYRVMVEADDADLAKSCAEELADLVREIDSQR